MYIEYTFAEVVWEGLATVTTRIILSTFNPISGIFCKLLQPHGAAVFESIPRTNKQLNKFINLCLDPHQEQKHWTMKVMRGGGDVSKIKNWAFYN